MDRKSFLAAAPAVPLAALATRTPERDSATFSLVVGDRTFGLAFLIDEHSTDLLRTFDALCVSARNEFVSRVVLPRQGRHES